MNKVYVPKTKEERERDLSDWIYRFKQAAILYDAGDERAAQFLSVQLRQIFHEREQHTPLSNLGLDRTSISFFNTPQGAAPFGLASSHGHGSTESGKPELQVEFEPIFDFFGTPWGRLGYENWWKDKIKTAVGLPFSREDIVLGVANKDGGAHVDEELEESFAKMSRQHDGRMSMSMGDVTGTSERGRQFACIRQIAFEVQLSLDEFLKPPVPYRPEHQITFPIHPRFFPHPFRPNPLSPIVVRQDTQSLLRVLADLEKHGQGNSLLAKHARSQIFWPAVGLPTVK